MDNKDILKIKNLKTSKTEKQLFDEVLALRAEKLSQLAITDWTQLPDVPLANAYEFSRWRQELRDLKINSPDDKWKIKNLLDKKPSPVWRTEDHEIDALAPTEVSLDEARAILKEVLVREKRDRLQAEDISSYNMFKLLKEALIDLELGGQTSTFLQEYMNITKMDLKEVDEKLKKYFATVNQIFFEFEEKISRIYTLSAPELEKELEQHGYRYRCADQDEPH